MNADLLDALLINIPRMAEVAVADIGDPAAMERRRQEVHSCLLGGSRATTCLQVDPSELIGKRPRWLDLCPHCSREVARLADEWPGDDFILDRYALLVETGRIPS